MKVKEKLSRGKSTEDSYSLIDFLKVRNSLNSTTFFGPKRAGGCRAKVLGTQNGPLARTARAVLGRAEIRACIFLFY